MLWFAVVVAACCIGVLVFAFGHEAIATLVVAVPYRRAAGLMPWIATGYAIRAASYVLERVCYAYGKTRRVLVIQVLAVVATSIVTPLGIFTLGIRCYGGARLFLNPTDHRGHSRAAHAPRGGAAASGGALDSHGIDPSGRLFHRGEHRLGGVAEARGPDILESRGGQLATQ
jgi:hypothetical protein